MSDDTNTVKETQKAEESQLVTNDQQTDQVAKTSPEHLALQQTVEPVAQDGNVESEETAPLSEAEPQAEISGNSVKAETHSKKRQSAKEPKRIAGAAAAKISAQNRWVKITGMVAGAAALVLLLVSAIASQYFKGKVMPNVSVAGISSAAKNGQQLKAQLESQKKSLKLAFITDEKTLKPKLDEIGLQIDVDKTVKNALNAKRSEGILAKISFWKHQNVPAVISINDTLISQYLETNTPNLSKAPQDAQLQFDANQAAFTITTQADGQGPNVTKLKNSLFGLATNLRTTTFKIGVAKKGPTITEAKLLPLLQPANELVSRQIVLTGLGYNFKAKPSDIAAWVTPTPQSNGSVKLVIDPAKIQSYVESISKKISSPPVDRKIVKDDSGGETAEVVLQEGRNGTELADKQTLANAIAQALKNGQDTTQVMNITTAAYKTVNMNAYDKWIEVDLSEQRTTAYERAKPVNTFTVATGVRGHDTPVGEYSIWLKVRSQTMKGGSKADGDYYDIPNVEWVSYFYQDYAIHGAWWRKVFGYPASHGCVNMTNDDAHWVYDWAPVGTKVIVHA